LSPIREDHTNDEHRLIIDPDLGVLGANSGPAELLRSECESRLGFITNRVDAFEWVGCNPRASGQQLNVTPRRFQRKIMLECYPTRHHPELITPRFILDEMHEVPDLQWVSQVIVALEIDPTEDTYIITIMGLQKVDGIEL